MGGLKTSAEFLHAHARARLFVLLFCLAKKAVKKATPLRV
jgi:hypothetical protein